MAGQPPPDPPTPRPPARPLGPLAIALASTLAVLLTLAPERAGPGVTCDELYYVATGKRLVAALRQQGLAFFHAHNVRRNFPWRPEDPADSPPVHPPLGTWILGLAHHLFDPSPDDPGVVSILAARFAPALALGSLVLLVGWWVTRREGALAGAVAAAATVLVPRVFGHGHLAALDTFTALSFVAALLALAWAAEKGSGVVCPKGPPVGAPRAGASHPRLPTGSPPLWPFGLAGAAWGLAMLTRLHGVLVLPPAIIWMLWRLGRKALLPLTAWFAVGIATLIAGWPWLWLDPIAHLRRFLATSVGRQAIHVYYVGQAWADRDVPRHYAVVMFLVALPLGLLLLGLLGLWAKRRDWKTPSADTLVAGSLGFVLGVFSLPGVPVYDGVRLFLMAFPIWAVSVGVGAKWLATHRVWRGMPRWAGAASVAVLVALQATGIVRYHPCWLSHYSLAVGGLWGAEKLGFEVTYWGDSVREPLLAETALVAPAQQVFFVPNLAPFQAPAVAISSPALIRGRVELVGWDANLARSPAGPRYAIVYRRRADQADVCAILAKGRVVLEYGKQGVWLARLVQLSGENPAECLWPTRGWTGDPFVGAPRRAHRSG